MIKTSLGRLAAVAAGGAFALATGAPALAHDEPADGFNAVLHGPHHEILADNDDVINNGCATLRVDAGNETADDLVNGTGGIGPFAGPRDVWVFNITGGGEFDATAATIARITFRGEGGGSNTMTIPTYPEYWIGPASNQHLLAVSVPAGWELVDGDFNVIGGSGTVVVTHTCPAESDTPTSPGPEPSASATPTPGTSATPGPGVSGTPGPGESEAPGQGGGLPVTGMEVGGLVAVGAALLVGGLALLAVRRRRGLADLTED